jgi:hypothetical protein
MHTGRVLVGKPEGKRPRHRWEDNIEINLKYDLRMWTGFVWPRTEISGKHL